MTSKFICIKSRWSLCDLKPGLYSFLNLASIGEILNFKEIDLIKIKFYCDGGLLCKLIAILTNNKIERISFDFTSIADEVFQYCQDSGKSVYFIGATENEICKFVEKIKLKYPLISIAGVNNGYFDNIKDISKSIININPDYVIAGLGAGKQEHFLIELHNHGFNGYGFSCGGFIRQYSLTNNEQYYPRIINDFKLRAFYRMYKEPHTIIRYLIDYPKNIFLLTLAKVQKRLNIKIC